MKLSFWKVSAISAMAVGVPLLGGCGLMQGPPVLGVPSPQETTYMTGHPFVLESVKFAPNVTPGKGTQEDLHCLPDSMYQEMLSTDLHEAFRNSGLAHGTGNPVPVEVTVLSRHFNSGIVTGTSHMKVRVRFGDRSVVGYLSGTGMLHWANTGPNWDLQQRIIPAMTLMITKSLLSVKAGKTYDNSYSFESRSVGGWVGQGQQTYNLQYPMSEHQMEQITGKSKAQLAQICHIDRQLAP